MYVKHGIDYISLKLNDFIDAEFRSCIPTCFYIHMFKVENKMLLISIIEKK